MTPGKVFKIRIPNGSHLLIKVAATTDPDIWDADAELEREDGSGKVTFTNVELRAGTDLELTGIRPARYRGQVRLRFPGPTSALVEILVRKPGGAAHGEDYSHIHSGPAADIVSLALFMD